MEIWGMVAVGFFTLAGVIVSNILQQRIMEKQRKRSLSDEARKLKRELMSSRLKVAEEQIGLMSRVIAYEINVITGGENIVDEIDIKAIERRVDEITSDAWTAIHLVGSGKLRKNYEVITQIYWNFIRTGRLTQDPDEWEKMDNAEMATIEILDNLRTFGNEQGR